MNRIDRLRLIGNIEGWSYLILLFGAMPLKYLAHQPLAVRIVGSIHGALFVAFCIVLLHAMRHYKWSLIQGGMAFGAALVPFGTFVLDRKLRQIEFPAD